MTFADLCPLFRLADDLGETTDGLALLCLSAPSYMPACSQIAGRINTSKANAHDALGRLRSAVVAAEKEIPGLWSVVVADLLDSVEQVEDE